jgi:hypothetical protein
VRIFHFGGEETCESIDELRLVLDKRFGSNANEFWIHPDHSDYPCIGLMVVQDHAYIQFFAVEGNPGYQPTGNTMNLNPDECTVFYTNTVDEEIEVPNDAVVSFSIALSAVEEFVISSELPTCFEWFEL